VWAQARVLARVRVRALCVYLVCVCVCEVGHVSVNLKGAYPWGVPRTGAEAWGHRPPEVLLDLPRIGLDCPSLWLVGLARAADQKS